MTMAAPAGDGLDVGRDLIAGFKRHDLIIFYI